MNLRDLASLLRSHPGDTTGPAGSAERARHQQLIPDTLISARPLLIEPEDRPALARSQNGPATMVPLTCQRSDLNLQGLRHGLQPKMDECLDQCNLDVKIFECWHGGELFVGCQLESVHC